ncbi:hypothetical protein B0T25DRAFT_571241 [Lasiosphaeria hispida]|uniref:ATP-grasp domain-containing protein n=1 Tax=Lasiosphaeria hispida TaxID=260671 RepID=A0AAJ0MAF8_9PEZI|nr:hypothetical protein B0T25DRAFT_571241 [Lasiosphaeria hispida]
MANREDAGPSWGIFLRSNKYHLYANLTPLWSSRSASSPSSLHWHLDFHVAAAAHAPPDSPDISWITVDDSHFPEHSAQHAFFTLDVFAALTSPKAQDSVIILRLLFPVSAGTPIRSDYIEYRLRDAPAIHAVRSFLTPLAKITEASPSITRNIVSAQNVCDLLRHSLGGLISYGSSPESATQSLTSELDYRLSVPWVAPSPPAQRQRILWIQGRANILSSQQFYLAAQALGITLVVADAPGHWMQDPSSPHAHLREAFVELNIDGDAALAQRIVDAVRAYPERIDGIVTISDARLPHVAKACEVLGLPSEGAEAYKIAGDKGATRRLVESRNGQGESLVLAGAEELEAELQSRGDLLRFPMIVKPCAGWNSDCVAKVSDVAELRAAVCRASERHAASPLGSKGVVVEPYIDGPEVDADFVILDGEVLFCYITDDFPCSGDSSQGGKNSNFMETVMDVPTALPDNEQAILRESLPMTIKQCGFKSGIFHCEARVRGSSVHYRPREDNSILDLHPREIVTQEQPSCYLHEINARPPGYANTISALLAHGVDYYAIRLLLALGYGREEEKQRIRALAQPFRGGKPQYTPAIAVLPPTREGVMGSDDCVVEFLEANPDLKEHVVWTETVKWKGDPVQGPASSELWTVGHVIVASRKGRKVCVEMAHRVREKFDYKLLGEP